METSTILILCSIGLCAGILSGFIGVGGGIIIVPALIYFIGLSQHQAQGVSLLLMLPPIGILAVMNYYKGLEMDKQYLWYAGIMAVCFIIGGFFGSKLSLKLSPEKVKFFFGLIMLIVAIKMIWSGSKYISK